MSCIERIFVVNGNFEARLTCALSTPIPGACTAAEQQDASSDAQGASVKGTKDSEVVHKPTICVQVPHCISAPWISVRQQLLLLAVMHTAALSSLHTASPSAAQLAGCLLGSVYTHAERMVRSQVRQLAHACCQAVHMWVCGQPWQLSHVITVQQGHRMLAHITSGVAAQ
jgi:hypothetical protein